MKKMPWLFMLLAAAYSVPVTKDGEYKDNEGRMFDRSILHSRIGIFSGTQWQNGPPTSAAHIRWPVLLQMERSLLEALIKDIKGNPKEDSSSKLEQRDQLPRSAITDYSINLDNPLPADGHGDAIDLAVFYKKRGGECRHVYGYDPVPIYVISRCPFSSQLTNTNSMCETTPPEIRLEDTHNNMIDIITTPVQDINGLVYKNVYCAQCNDAFQVMAWRTTLECENMLPLEVSDGFEKMILMREFTHKSFCTRKLKPAVPKMIHQCSKEEVLTMNGHGNHQVRVSSSKGQNVSPFPLSFSILMNFGFDGKTHILFSTAPEEQYQSITCKKNEIYDPKYNLCRPVLCDVGYELVEGMCEQMSQFESNGNMLADGNVDDLQNVDDIMEVTLTIKNVSSDVRTLLGLNGIEYLLKMQFAEILNITMDRIRNVTVKILESSSHNQENHIEFHRVRPTTIVNQADDEMILDDERNAGLPSKSRKGSSGQNETAKGEKGLTTDMNSIISSNSNASFHSWDASVAKTGNINSKASNFGTSKSSKAMFSIDISKDEVLTEDDAHVVFNGSFHGNAKDENVNATEALKMNARLNKYNSMKTKELNDSATSIAVQVMFLLFPAHENKTQARSVKTIVQTMSNMIDSNSFMMTINGTDLKFQSLENGTKPLSMDMWCTKGIQKFVMEGDFDVVIVHNDTTGRNETKVYVNATHSLYGPGEFDLTVSVDGTVGNLSEAIVTSFVFVCVMPRIVQKDCVRITLNRLEYQLLSNKSILFSDKVYNLNEYHYADEAAETVRVCAPDWSSMQSVHSNKWALVCGNDLLQLALAESYLTFGLGMLSLLATMSVLLTYLQFRKLRNLPGVNTVNLTLALFLGELVFITSGYMKPHYNWLCSAVGMLLHYLFLASFFWMNVMSYDVFRTFANECILTHIRSKTKYLPRYALYAWGSPAIIVGICAFVDFSHLFTNVRVGYGGTVQASPFSETQNSISSEEDISQNKTMTSGQHVYQIGCWIQEPVAAVISFGAPMILILLSNFVMFTRTIICIRASTKSTFLKIRRSSKGHIIGKDDVMLYIRMSTVMGFTWIFGLASSIISAFAGPPSKTICIVLHVFGILFIIFNCSQGLFIFFAFVANKRVTSLYKAKFRKWRQRRSCSSNSQATLISFTGSLQISPNLKQVFDPTK
ncbi:hypothetical protein CHS0354_012361 [Potamilus streckersoni]|uniref:G-protein coupled receptors family 2 profile 2 domain-containing protein n=1 Tax=Potamilus streckersoni TaxID=2493646 RepID=A0AAE0SKA2_9BIVA|nr:hypothetical protein CHS0354_012361 [Potamilus streckersoni]